MKKKTPDFLPKERFIKIKILQKCINVTSPDSMVEQPVGAGAEWWCWVVEPWGHQFLVAAAVVGKPSDAAAVAGPSRPAAGQMGQLA